MAKILLVEDNELNRDMLKRRLERREHEVAIAVDGGEGEGRDAGGSRGEGDGAARGRDAADCGGASADTGRRGLERLRRWLGERAERALNDYE